jgi:CRP-like cAMP-binding protein
MISPEILRRYPFFAPFNEAELRELALVAEETQADAEQVLFEEGQSADSLYLLIDGGVDLLTAAHEEYYPKQKKEFLLGEINPGEVFAISALLQPYRLTCSARTSRASRFIQFDALALRALFAANCHLGYNGMVQISKALQERLNNTRIQLAAAWT